MTRASGSRCARRRGPEAPGGILRGPWARRLGVALALLAPLVTLSARAQSPDAAEPGELSDEAATARARALFTDGVGHAHAERWEEAVGAFREALALRAAATIRYNLAAALVEVGDVRAAHTQLLALEADPETPGSLAELAVALRGRIEAEFGRLRIELDVGLAGAVVSLDGVMVSGPVLSTAIPVANGEHTLLAVRGAETVARASATTTPGQVAHVVLSGEPGVSVEAPVAATETALTDEPAFWLAIGGGALVVVGAIVLAVVLAGSQGGGAPIAGDFEPALITWP